MSLQDKLTAVAALDPATKLNTSAPLGKVLDPNTDTLASTIPKIATPGNTAVMTLSVSSPSSNDEPKSSTTMDTGSAISDADIVPKVIAPLENVVTIPKDAGSAVSDADIIPEVIAPTSDGNSENVVTMPKDTPPSTEPKLNTTALAGGSILDAGTMSNSTAPAGNSNPENPVTIQNTGENAAMMDANTVLTAASPGNDSGAKILLDISDEKWPEWLKKHMDDLGNVHGPENFRDVVRKLAIFELVMGFPTGHVCDQLSCRYLMF